MYTVSTWANIGRAAGIGVLAAISCIKGVQLLRPHFDTSVPARTTSEFGDLKIVCNGPASGVTYQVGATTFDGLVRQTDAAGKHVFYGKFHDLNTGHLSSGVMAAPPADVDKAIDLICSRGGKSPASRDQAAERIRTFMLAAASRASTPSL